MTDGPSFAPSSPMGWAGLRLAVLRWAGGLANLAGLPGFVRETKYTSQATHTAVTVRRSAYFTVITVNGVEVYFNRLTGSVDGTAVSHPRGAK